MEKLSITRKIIRFVSRTDLITVISFLVSIVFIIFILRGVTEVRHIIDSVFPLSLLQATPKLNLEISSTETIEVADLLLKRISIENKNRSLDTVNILVRTDGNIEEFKFNSSPKIICKVKNPKTIENQTHIEIQCFPFTENQEAEITLITRKSTYQRNVTVEVTGSYAGNKNVGTSAIGSFY